MHTVLATQAVAGLASLSHLSAGQATAAAVPPAQNWPAAQGVRAGADDGLGDEACTVPAGQAVAARQMD